MELVTHTSVTSAVNTVDLVEAYTRRVQETDSEYVRDQLAGRVNELLTVGLAQIAEEGGNEDLRDRLEEAAVAAWKAAGLDGPKPTTL